MASTGAGLSILIEFCGVLGFRDLGLYSRGIQRAQLGLISKDYEHYLVGLKAIWDPNIHAMIFVLWP